MAGPADRTQALLPDLHRDVHGVLVPVRHRHQPAAARGVPAVAGIVRRRTAARAAIGHPRYVRTLAARPRILAGGDRRDLRADHRPDTGRLDHRQLFLALGVPDQRAGRHLRIHLGDAVGRGSALGAARSRAPARHRLWRPGIDRARPGFAADHAGSRRGPGLVQFNHHPDLRAAGRGGHRRRHRLAADGREAGGRSALPEGPQFRRRRGHGLRASAQSCIPATC